MRDLNSAFAKAGATVVAVAKDDLEAVTGYWTENRIPFSGVPDPEGTLGARYGQQSKIGLMPAVFVIDRSGVIRFAHYGTGMADIPSAAALLEEVEKSR